MKNVLVFLMILAVASLANAVVVPITNGGFENPALADNTVVNAYWTGWNCWAPAAYVPASNKGFGVRDPLSAPLGTEAYPVTATEGENYGILGRIDTLQATYDYAWQSTVVIAANTVYTLKFDIAAITAAPWDSFIDGALFASSSTGTLGTSIANYYDDTIGGTSTYDYTWHTDKTVTFDSTTGGHVGEYLQIEFSGNRICVDNVRLESIPEPATMALLGLGSLALVRRKRA